MSLSEVFTRVLSEYASAKSAPLENHPLAIFLRGEAESAVEEGLGEFGTGMLVQGSPGQGNWAEVPWISVFDPAITTSATTGYYVVCLFHSSQPTLHLSLNQGTTSIREEFGSRTRDFLRDRAALIRKRLSDYSSLLPISAIDLGSDARLPGDYAAGHALGKSYELASIPDEAELRTDLQRIVQAYRALTYRGGLDADVDTQRDVSEEFYKQSLSIVETRKYAFHRKIERNRTAVKQAKKFHGTICQACNLNFSDKYGSIGDGFIEAHHLRPLATLEEGVAVRYDVSADFAVLCSNCHRMIHRSGDPSDLQAFQALVQSKD